MDAFRSEDGEQSIRARLAEIGLDEDPEAAQEVVGQFVEAVRDHTDALHAAVGQTDLLAVVHAAHKLSGTAVTLGADALGRLASRLESDAASGRDATLKVQAEAIREEAARTIAAADSILAST